MSIIKPTEKPALSTTLPPQFYSNQPAVKQRSAAMIQHDTEAALCLRWLQIGD